MRGEPGGFVLSPHYARNADRIQKFEPRRDDVWVVTFPKCGKVLVAISSNNNLK